MEDEMSEHIKEAVKSFLKTVTTTFLFFFFFVVMFFSVILLTRHAPLRVDGEEGFFVVSQEEETTNDSDIIGQSSMVKIESVGSQGVTARVVSPVAPIGGSDRKK